MANYLRAALIPELGGQQDDDGFENLLKDYASRPAPKMPGLRPSIQPRQLPQRRQQSWLDLLPQLLGAAGDVVGAGIGQRPYALNQVMGIQGGLREQAYQDELARAMMPYEAEQRAYEDQWRRYSAEQQAMDREFNRRYKMSEIAMMRKLMGERQEQARAEELKPMRRELAQQFGTAETVEDLKRMAETQRFGMGDDQRAKDELFRQENLRLQQLILEQQKNALRGNWFNPFGLFSPPKPNSMPLEPTYREMLERERMGNWYSPYGLDRRR